MKKVIVSLACLFGLLLCACGDEARTVQSSDASTDLAPPDLPAPDQATPDLATPDQATPDLPAADLAPPDMQPMDLLIPDLIPPDMPPPTCTDKKKNGQETDVDCGGGTCPKCAD